MKLIIHDLGIEYNEILKNKADKVVYADGRYAPCQGCFKCWTKHPASCELKDSLHEMSRVIGQADDLIVICENCYGGQSPSVKNLLDRSIGISTPFSTYRGKMMHHTLRYGKKNKYTLVVYGDMNEKEKSTLQLMNTNNSINNGFEKHEVVFLSNKEEVKELSL